MSLVAVKSSLYKLEEVGTTRSWDYTQPTLQIKGRYTHRSPLTNESFAETFFHEFPALKGMDWSNMVLRGGAIIDLLLQRPVHDLDFYFYGYQPGDEAGILRRAETFLAYLLEVERKYVESLIEERKQLRKRARHIYEFNGISSVERIDIKGIRRGTVITVQLSAIKKPLQLVLVMYDSKEQMTSTSDIATSGAIFDGKDVWLSQEAKWELENMTIRVKKGFYPSSRRLHKYFHNKGFDICLPELDVTKLPRGYIDFGWRLVDAIRTPKLGFSYSALEENRITVASFFDVTENSGSMTSKYSCGDKDLDRFDSRSVMYSNIRVLAKLCGTAHSITTTSSSSSSSSSSSVAVVEGNEKDEESSFSVYAEADFIKDVLKPWPDLTSRQVENTYAGIASEIYRDHKFDFDVYNKYVTVVPLSDTLDKIKNAPTKTFGIISDAVSTQVAATKALVVDLQQRYQGASAPVHSVDAAFLLSTSSDGDAFYGAYRRH